MKNIACFILMIVTCLGMSGCSDGPGDERIVGKWYYQNSFEGVTFNKDLTGNIQVNGKKRKFDWTFDEATRRMLITLEDSEKTESCLFLESMDSIYIDGLIYAREGRPADSEDVGSWGYEVMGQWEADEGDSKIVLRDDYYGYFVQDDQEVSLEWYYDEETHALLLIPLMSAMAQDAYYLPESDCVIMGSQVFERTTPFISGGGKDVVDETTPRVEDLQGQWKAQQGDISLDLNQDGTGILVQDGTKYAVQWEYDILARIMQLKIEDRTSVLMGSYLQDQTFLYLNGIVFERPQAEAGQSE